MKSASSKDFLKEAQDDLRESIYRTLRADKVNVDRYKDVDYMTRSLFNIAQYIKLNRELNEEGDQ